MSNASGSGRSSDAVRRLGIEQRDDVIVFVPDGDLGEFAVTQIAEEAESVVNQLKNNANWRHLVIDFHKTDYFGSSALGLFLRLWKRVQEHGGKMAVCNLSEHEQELLKITRLTEFWSLSDDLESALQDVTKQNDA